MINLPEKYLENMKQLLQDEYDNYLESFNNERTYGLRINTNKISVRDFLNINPFKLTPIPWTDDGFYFDSTDVPSKHPYYYAGLYYLQEPSAMLPAQIMPVQAYDKILDGCGAPGGKSVKLANKLNNSGILFSNDISVSRSQISLKTLVYQGVKNSFVLSEDISKLERFKNYFDCILIDAPCSGEGMFRKQNDLIKSWVNKGNDYYSEIQKKIIISALRLLKDGGYLVYSTCTFSKQENEEVIEYALSNCQNLKVLPIKKYPGFVEGLSDKTRNCVRLYPHRIKGEGHFVALLQKGQKINNNIINSNKEEYFSFDNINIKLHNGQFINRKEKLYYEPLCDIDLKGLRILRSGLYLGEYRHDRFEPSHSLAMALKSSEYHNILNFNCNDERVIKYLKCETLDVKDKYVQGDALVCVDGYPLGFASVKKGILKNKYPADFRYR